MFGDSVMERISKYDQDQRDLGAMLRDRFNKNPATATLAHRAYNMQMFLLLLQALQRMQGRPRMVIVPVNLRSFSPQWFHNPQWQFPREILALNHYLRDPKKNILSISTGADAPPSLEEFDSLPVEYDSSNFYRVGHFRLIVQSSPETNEQRLFRWKQIFIFHYMFKLRPDHPLLNSLKEILELITKMEIIGVIYTTSINYAAGERHLGPEFHQRHLANMGVVSGAIRPYLASGRIKFMDWSRALDSSYFFHENEPTEHLNESGREILVDKLSTCILAAEQETQSYDTRSQAPISELSC
jgi:hypothetical protein